MGRHERRHSFDFSYSNNDDYEQEKQRKVHFDDEYLACGRKQTRRRSLEDEIREMNVCETTTKLKESYQNIDKGLEILRRVYENLKHSKQSVRYGRNSDNERCQKEFISEINTLLEQVENLEKALRKSGTQKRQYLDELFHLQRALHEDRVKIESARESRKQKQDLHAKMNESTKVTRDQQITINKLKRDNQNLWRILQEVKKHLIDEEAEAVAEEVICGKERKRVDKREFFEGSSLPNTPPRSEKFKFECELFPMREGSEDGGSSSTGSCSDAVLSDKLKYLISRSENIQNMITKVGESRLNRSLSDDCLHQSSEATEFTKRCRESSVKRSDRRREEQKERACSEERRIPSENERGVRCDTKDIIRRCEELEKRVEQCSTKDMRDRLIRQLEDIDQSNTESRHVTREQREEEEEGYCSAGNFFY